MPSDASKVKTTDYERGVYLAKLLWCEPLAGLMTAHLGDVRTLEKSTPDIMLASTLPLDSIHAAMFKMLKKRAGDGPQPLETAGWSDKVLTDPGLLVVMKLLLISRSKTFEDCANFGQRDDICSCSDTARPVSSAAQTAWGRYGRRRWTTYQDRGGPEKRTN